MTAVVELLSRCRAMGIELAVGAGGAALVWEWGRDADPPADLLADLSANKSAVLALVRGPHGNCHQCGRALDDRRRCWRCCDRLCPCGRPTGSAFIEVCIACGLALDAGAAVPGRGVPTTRAASAGAWTAQPVGLTGG